MSSLNEMMNYTFVSKYARWLKDEKRRETWKEAVDRGRNMMLIHYKDKGVEEEINWAYDMLWKKKVLGSQRSLEDSTPLPTPTGWKNVGDIKVGDKLFDSQGNPCNVLKVIAFKNIKLSKVVFSDNSILIASLDHLWVTSTLDDRVLGSKKNIRKTRVVNTEKIKNSLTQSSGDANKYNHVVWHPKPLQLPNITLPLNPYVLGHWLGDGSKRDGLFACHDKDIEICDFYEECGFPVHRHLSNPYARSTRGLTTVLRKIGLLNNKHIPKIYLRASFKQRLKVVQGLMDSDGSCTPEGRCLFSNTNIHIINGLKELLASLGIKYNCHIKEAIGNNQKQYYISFFTTLHVFRLRRKLNNLRKVLTKQNYYRAITNVEKYKRGNASCFIVDSPDNTYLAGKSMIVTHNCLQFGGQPILDKNARLFNCWGSYCDRPRFFQEVFWLLLCGGGTGSSMQLHHTNKLPSFRTNKTTNKSQTFIIPDTIEGWADAIGVLITHYLDTCIQPEWEKYTECRNVVFDYSQIRPQGSMLSSGVGKAPGHMGLKRTLDNINKLLLDRKQNLGLGKLRPIDCYDIKMHISDACLAGGVRRCLPKNTKIFTKSGYKDICDIKIGDSVKTNNGYKKVTNVFYQGRRILTKIVTNVGDFYSTSEHRWATAKNIKGDILWKKTKALNSQDVLIFNNFLAKGRKTKFPQDDNYTPPVLDSDSSWFLGYFLGDGSVSKCRRQDDRYKNQKSYDCKLRVVTDASTYIPIYHKLKTQFIRFTPKYGECYHNGGIELTSSKKNITEYFLNHIKQPNTIINIPKFIFEAKPEIRAACLAGILDSDGSVRNDLSDGIGTGQIALVSTKYYEFARDIQILYSSFGIPTKMKVKDRSHHGKSTEYIVGTISRVFCKKAVALLQPYSIKLQTDYVAKPDGVSRYGLCFPKKFAQFEQIGKIWLYHSKISYERAHKHGLANFIPITIIDVIKTSQKEDVYDIEVEKDHCFYADGILTHNSASICLFSANDKEMATAKTGNWFKDNPQRARSNNSAILLRNSTTKQEFVNLMTNVREFGEPGFIWTDDLELLINPCSEVTFWAYGITDGKKYNKYMTTYRGTGYDKPLKDIGLQSGWQACNLSTVNTALVKSVEDFEEYGKAAAILGTLQAGFTQFDYLEDVSQLICEREALLGVSMTGMMEQPNITLDPSNQKRVAKIVIKTNKEFSKKLGINQAARTTAVKPEGTSSCLLGTSSSLHPHHAKRYLRLCQANKTENPYQHFKKTNPQACMKSAWSSNNIDDIIAFPIEVPDGSKTKNQVPALELLNIVKSTQLNWVGAGKNVELCTQPWLTHNVSNTITVLPDEWDEVTDYIYKNRKHFCGIALLPQSGDKDYVQAPFTAVYTSREIVREYGEAALWTSGLIEIALESYDNLWVACDAALQDKTIAEAVSKNGNGNSKSWAKISKQCLCVEKMTKFANKYFDGDVKRLTYCMKDVYNWKFYCDLKDSFQPVDYTAMIEEQDETKLEAEPACAGGACLI